MGFTFDRTLLRCVQKEMRCLRFFILSRVRSRRRTAEPHLVCKPYFALCSHGVKPTTRPMPLLARIVRGPQQPAHRALPAPRCTTSSLCRSFTFPMTSSKGAGCHVVLVTIGTAVAIAHRICHNPRQAPSAHTHTTRATRPRPQANYPHEPRTTHRTRHRTATPLFCSSVPTCHACSSRGELTRRPTPTLPQPALAHRWCALYICRPLSTSPQAPYLRHSTRCVWVRLLAGSVILVGLRSALLLQPRQLGIARCVRHASTRLRSCHESVS